MSKICRNFARSFSGIDMNFGKKIRHFLPLFVLTAGLVFSTGITAREYIGTMELESGFTMEKVRVSLDETGNITMYRVKFARIMPVKVDVLIPKVQIIGKEHPKSLKGDNIIPLVHNDPYPKRKISKLKGKVSAQSLSFECEMGGKKLHYKGQKL